MELSILKDTPPWEWPEGTGKMLLGVLRDERAPASDLLLAVELAGDSTVVDDELAGALLAILRSDHPEEVRGQAAIALGPALEEADLEGFDDGDEYAMTPITEQTFQRIRESLRELYQDAGVPKQVRRRILEASVRSPQDWHQDAIRAAYSGEDDTWRLTAVFCMRFVRGFDDQILEALDSEDPDIHYEAVQAAGSWAVDAAWEHVAALVTSRRTDKSLLLVAIDAAGSIRPREAASILHGLLGSRDEDIVEAVHEALAMAGGEDEDEEEENGGGALRN